MPFTVKRIPDGRQNGGIIRVRLPGGAVGAIIAVSATLLLGVNHGTEGFVDREVSRWNERRRAEFFADAVCAQGCDHRRDGVRRAPGKTGSRDGAQRSGAW